MTKFCSTKCQCQNIKYFTHNLTLHWEFKFTNNFMDLWNLWLHAHSMFLNLTSIHMKWKSLHWWGRLLEAPPRPYSWLPGYPYLHPQSLCYLHPPLWPVAVTPDRWGRSLQLTKRRRTWHSCKAQIPFRSLIQEGCHRKQALTRNREAHHSQRHPCIRQHAANTIKAGS